jgi:Tetratricopeptide repeat
MRLCRVFVALFVLCSGLQALCDDHQPQLVRYSLPGKKGALELSLHSLTIKQVNLSDDGTKLRVVASDGAGVNATVFVQPAENGGGASACRDAWWPGARDALVQKAKVQIEDVKQYRAGEMEIVRFRVPKFQQQPVNLTDMHGYLAGGELWAEIHVSETGSRTRGRVLEELLSTGRMLPAYVPGVMDYFQFGEVDFRAKKYDKAAAYYQKALDLNAAGEQLDATLWKVLVDQLGMSYGISGDLERSKKVFEAAIAKDPSYPMFYYNLACAEAESENLDAALKNIQLAFDRRRNIIAGEHMPDPRTDDSFARFKNEKRFQELMAKLNLD